MRRPHALVHAAFGLTAGLGCSVALDPENVGDVEYCINADDCTPPEDTRLAAACIEQSDAVGDLTDGVCIAKLRSLSCDPFEYDLDHPLRVMYQMATAAPEAYTGRCHETPGVQGCPPGPDGCKAGLSVHPRSGFCDDEDPSTPPALGNAIQSIAGQDVLDQFCRSFFCDMDFVCDRSGKEFTCVPCDDDYYGRGGCGDLYFDGERSPVYQTAEELRRDCQGARAEEDGVAFGELPADR